MEAVETLTDAARRVRWAKFWRRLASAAVVFAGLMLTAPAAWSQDRPGAGGAEAAGPAEVTPASAMSTTRPAAESAEVAQDGFFAIVFSGGWVGVLIILTLVALSMATMYLIVEQLMVLRERDVMPIGLAEEVRQLLSQGKLPEADAACRNRPSPLSFVLLSGLSEIDFGWTAMEKAMEDAIAEQAAKLIRKVEYLSVIGNLAPMCGLLGTVTGMIFAFQQVAVSRGNAGAADLAQGIYSALVTTVAGLIVAIPSLAAFAVFRNRIDQLIAEAAYVAQHVFTPVRRRASQMLPRGNTPPAPPRA